VCLYVCHQETPKREVKGPPWTISVCELISSVFQFVNVTTLLKHPGLCYNLCMTLVPFAAFRLMTKEAESIN
jgi:hypothetical protein